MPSGSKGPLTSIPDRPPAAAPARRDPAAPRAPLLGRNGQPLDLSRFGSDSEEDYRDIDSDDEDGGKREAAVLPRCIPGKAPLPRPVPARTHLAAAAAASAPKPKADNPEPKLVAAAAPKPQAAPPEPKKLPADKPVAGVGPQSKCLPLEVKASKPSSPPASRVQPEPAKSDAEAPRTAAGEAFAAALQQSEERPGVQKEGGQVTDVEKVSQPVEQLKSGQGKGGQGKPALQQRGEREGDCPAGALDKPVRQPEKSKGPSGAPHPGKGRQASQSHRAARVPSVPAAFIFSFLGGGSPASVASAAEAISPAGPCADLPSLQAVLPAAAPPLLQGFGQAFVRPRDKSDEELRRAWDAQREALAADFKSKQRTAMKHAGRGGVGKKPSSGSR